MTRRLTVILLLLFCIPAYTASGFVQEHESNIRLNLFAPGKVRLDFEYTKNVTVGDVSAMGPSLYEVTHSPMDFSFEARDVDHYRFNVELSYEVLTIQTVILTIFSGSQPPSSVEIPVDSARLTFNFDVTCSPEPMYPSKEEITERVVSHILDQLERYHVDNLNTFRLFNAGLNNVVLLMGVVVVLIIVVCGILYTVIRRREERSSLGS